MISLEPDNTYHVYNRANGSEKIFQGEGNYHFFLGKYRIYISPIAHTYCYCLMPNHFHFLLRIKGEIEIPASTFPKFQTLEKLISKQFSNLFSSYTQAFNKQQSRKGSLFMKNFKRKRITDEKYLRKMVHYIHYNPIEANLCDKPNGWKFSSYNDLLDSRPSFTLKNEVIDWFEDKENFIFCHSYPPQETGVE